MGTLTEVLLSMQQRVNYYQNKPAKDDAERSGNLHKALGLIEAMEIVQKLGQPHAPN